MSRFKQDPQFALFASEVIDQWALSPEANMQKMKNFVTNSDYVPDEDKPELLKQIDLLEASKEQSARYLDKLYPETAQKR